MSVARIIRVFVSSPSDVQEEREIVHELIDVINREKDSQHVVVKTFDWTRDVVSQLGPGPQPIVDGQTPEYHIYLGIMWARMGTPTDRHPSGTVKEFYDAYDRFTKAGRRSTTCQSKSIWRLTGYWNEKSRIWPASLRGDRRHLNGVIRCRSRSENF